MREHGGDVEFHCQPPIYCLLYEFCKEGPQSLDFLLPIAESSFCRLHEAGGQA